MFYYALTITSNDYINDKRTVYEMMVRAFNKRYHTNNFEYTYEKTDTQKNSQLHIHGIVESERRINPWIYQRKYPRAHIVCKELTTLRDFLIFQYYCNKDQKDRSHHICKYIKPIYGEEVVTSHPFTNRNGPSRFQYPKFDVRKYNACIII